MEEANLAVKLSRLSLCVVGVWPDLRCSRPFAIVSNLVFGVSAILIGYFIVIAQTTKLFFSGNDLDTIVDTLCTADIPVFVALVKMIMLRYDFEVVKSLLQQFYDDWRAPHTQSQARTMRLSAHIGRKIAAACMGLAYGTSNVFFLLRLIALRQKQARTGCRVFLFESRFVLHDVTVTPWFELTWLVQALCTFSATTAYSGIDSFFAVLVLHLCGQLSILRDELGNLAIGQKDDDASVTKEVIARIVKRHNELNKYAETIEATFNRMFLAQIIGCVVQFCLQGYQIINIAVDRTLELPYLQLIFMIMYICYMSLDLYIYCYVAEKLRGESMKISSAAYNSEWYNLKGKDVNDLILIMKRAQYPLDITAGKFCSLSLRLFAIIAKTSLGYLSMLLAMKERIHKAA